MVLKKIHPLQKSKAVSTVAALCAVTARRRSVCLFEHAAKIERILKAHRLGDLADPDIGSAQKSLRMRKAKRRAVLNGAFARPVTEASVKIGDADTAHLCIFFYFFIEPPLLTHRVGTSTDRIVKFFLGSINCPLLPIKIPPFSDCV